MQGKTLDTTVVSMEGKGSFMPGQAYVAMSRVKRLDGLFLLGFDNKSSIRANPAVLREIDRLRKDLTQQDGIPAVVSNDDTSLNIHFLNVRSYLKHLPDLKADQT